MTHCLTPREVKAEISLESCPTLRHTSSSTKDCKAGSVSPSKPTATRRPTPCLRANSANTRVSVRLPALKPRVWVPFVILALSSLRSEHGRLGSGKQKQPGITFEAVQQSP